METKRLVCKKDFSVYIIIYYIIYQIIFTRIRQEAIWLDPELIEVSLWLALSNFDQRFSGEKPWDFSPDENSPYFVLAATWDQTRDLPLSVEFRVVPTLLPIQPQRLRYE